MVWGFWIDILIHWWCLTVYFMLDVLVFEGRFEDGCGV